MISIPGVTGGMHRSVKTSTDMGYSKSDGIMVAQCTRICLLDLTPGRSQYSDPPSWDNLRENILGIQVPCGEGDSLTVNPTDNGPCEMKFLFNMHSEWA